MQYTNVGISTLAFLFFSFFPFKKHDPSLYLYYISLFVLFFVLFIFFLGGVPSTSYLNKNFLTMFDLPFCVTLGGFELLGVEWVGHDSDGGESRLM